MKITNKMNLPMPFVRMAESDYTYTPKRYSITTLLKPTREILLSRRHDHEIEQDCSEMIWALLGQAVHHVLERAADGKNEFAEERLEHCLENGYTVSGIIDLYDMEKQEVIDYKTISVTKAIKQDFEDWRKQGLGYVWLLLKNGLPCKSVKFYGILRDWSKNKVYREQGYPQLPVIEVEFSISGIDEIDEFIRTKIDELRYFEAQPDYALPICSEEDRWHAPDIYAVMKKGRKSALRKLPSQAAAEDYISTVGGDYIEFRKGKDVKCQDYCRACKYCDYYLQEVANATEEETE